MQRGLGLVVQEEEKEEEDEELADLVAELLPHKKLIFSARPAAASQKTPDKIIALALDYDGCADILFMDQPRFKELPEDRQGMVKQEQDFLYQHLLTLSKNMHTELYVGSARQDIVIDNRGAMKNKNGSCFMNFSSLALAQEWNFNTLLLSDITYDAHKIVHIAPNQGISKSNKTVPFDSLPLWHSDPMINIKLNTILAHIHDLQTKYPTQEVEYYFYDDDIGLTNPREKSILTAAANFFEKNPDSIPANICLNLMFFDYCTRIVHSQKGIQPDANLLYWSSKQNSSSMAYTVASPQKE